MALSQTNRVEAMENHSWVLEVLSDLELYARGNHMPDLAKVLPAVRRVASNEIAAIPLKRNDPFPGKGDNFVVIASTGEPALHAGAVVVLDN